MAALQHGLRGNDHDAALHSLTTHTHTKVDTIGSHSQGLLVSTIQPINTVTVIDDANISYHSHKYVSMSIASSHHFLASYDVPSFINHLFLTRFP